MSADITRRDFLQVSAAGVSAIALGAPGTAKGYPANEKVQLGWIGVGGRAGQLMPLVVEHCPDARIAAVCDLIPERIENGKKMAERDKPNGYEDFRKMMDEEKLDGILVVTRPMHHAMCVIPVLERKVHCFAEKPMDATVENIDKLTVAARKAWKDDGVLYQIGTQRRYHPGYKACIKAIHDGTLGTPTFMVGHWLWPWMMGRWPTESGGGFLNEQSCHHTDVAIWALKEQLPLRSVAMAKSQAHPDDPDHFIETQSSTNWEFPEDVIFNYRHMFYLARKFESEELILHGTDGGMDFVHGKFYKFQPPPYDKPMDEGTQIGIDSGNDWNIGTTEELQDFVANVKTGGKRLPAANVETGRACALMCLMGRQAAVNAKENRYEPSVVEWKDIGTTTDKA